MRQPVLRLYAAPPCGDPRHHAAPHPTRHCGAEFDAIDAGNDDGVWWTYPKGQRSFTADAYKGAEESIEAVESALVDGGFCGLVGFSQGAILGSIIAARAALGEGVSGLRFAVLCSGAVPKPYAPTLDRLRAAGGGGSVRTLHCLSAVDAMNPPEQGEALAAAFGPSAEVLWHDGGHAMPPPGEALKRTAEFLDRAYADGGG